MTRKLSPDVLAELSSDVRRPQLMLRIDLPSADTTFVTGDPTNVSTRYGTPIQHNLQIGRVEDGGVAVVFQLADISFVSDLLGNTIGGRTVQVWSYWEHANTVTDADMVPQFHGIVSRITGGVTTATLQAVPEVVLLPTRRINPTGGFNWLTPPKVLHINGAIFTLRRAGLV